MDACTSCKDHAPFLAQISSADETILVLLLLRFSSGIICIILYLNASGGIIIHGMIVSRKVN